MSELAAADAYRKKLAALEHHALSSTLRDRLINSVTNKKNRLSRDRETIEIGESNALLLHPSQFGLANPASPGGMHSKRATRHRRDAEELPNFAEGNKRKRKAGDSDESPAPTRQRLDNGSSTPLWFAEKNAMHAAQIDSALYSIDKLFTEKELAMTYNQAALAAHRYMQRHQPYAEDVDTPPNGKSESGSEQEKAITAGELDLNDDADSPPGGADMARQFSHATRSTRGAMIPNYVTGLGIDALGDLNYPGNMEALTKQIPKMPPFLAAAMQKGYVKGDAANQPAGLSNDEANAELDIIRRGRSYNDTAGFGRNLELDNGGKPLLEAVAAPKRYEYWVKSDNKSLLEGKTFLTSNLREELAGGEPMSKQSSRGVSEMGGTPMSRQNTGEGGTSSRGRKLKPISGMV